MSKFFLFSSDLVDYLANRWFAKWFYWKIFQTKIGWLEGEHMTKIWTWTWVTLSKSGQGHYCFFKSLFFITYSCSLSRELFKTL